MSGKELKKFNNTMSVNGAGELTVNAGRYSRAAVIMAFELNGGIEKFAEWADENQTDFYTKLFGKLIGRETEASSTDDVESMLSVLDGESEDITDAELVEDDDVELAQDVFEPSARDIRLVKAAAMYADGEPVD